MDGDRILQALSRIDAAADRIAAAARAGDAGGDPQLEARYDALRREAGAALSQIDRLIASLEGAR